MTKYEIENPNPNFDDEMRQIAALKERVERELPELKRRKTNVKVNDRFILMIFDQFKFIVLNCVLFFFIRMY